MATFDRPAPAFAIRLGFSRIGAWLVGIAAAASLLAAPEPVRAQSTEMVIPIAAGGAMDAAVRAIGGELSKKWQEPVVPVNKPGAGMVLGVKYLLGLNPEGRSLLAGGLPMTTIQYRTGGAPFDFAELAPVAYLGWQGTVLYIRATIPANTVAEFVQWSKTQPQGVLFASSGVGSSPHIAAEEFAATTGMRMTHVPYTGSGAFTPAILGGHVDAVFDAPSSRVHVQAGRLKALMVGASRPLANWPELPTSEQAGLPGFKSGTWYGFFTSAKTPPAVRGRLNADINDTLRLAAVRERLDQLGIEPIGGSEEAFGKLLKAEHDRLGQIIKSRNIEIN